MNDLFICSDSDYILAKGVKHKFTVKNKRFKYFYWHWILFTMESLEPNSIFQNKMTFQLGDGLVKVGINNFNVVFALESLQIDLFNIVIIFQG